MSQRFSDVCRPATSLTCGLEFGVPGYRWLPAKGTAQVRYCAFLHRTETIPDDLCWDGAWDLS